MNIMTIVAQKHVGEYEFVITRADGTVEIYQQKNRLNPDVIKEIYKNPSTLDTVSGGMVLCLSTKLLAETFAGVPDPLVGKNGLNLDDDNYGNNNIVSLAMDGVNYTSSGVFLSGILGGYGYLSANETFYNRTGDNKPIKSAMVAVYAGGASGIDLDTPITLKPNDSITVKYNLLTPLLDFNFSKQFEVNGVQVTGTVRSLKDHPRMYDYYNAFAYMQAVSQADFTHPDGYNSYSRNGLIAARFNNNDGTHRGVTDSLDSIICTQSCQDGITIKNVVSFTLKRDTDIKQLLFIIGNTLAEMDFGKNVRFLEDQVVKFEFETVINYD